MARILVLAGVFMGDKVPGRNKLVETGFDVVDYKRPGPLPEDELIPALEGFEAAVAGNDPFNERVMSAAPTLRAVARHGVGTDSVDLVAAARLGVIVTNTPGIIVDSVADMAFAHMLAVARRVCEADRAVRAGKWQEIQGPLVWGKTLGLVGVGAIGMAMVRRALGFGMTILAYDPYPRAEAEELGVKYVSLDELLREADFVSIHAPLTSHTRGMIGKREIGLMKPTAYLINTARGGLVDQDALYEALAEKRIAGAGLDVLVHEPPSPDDPLLKLENCVFTPHNAHNAKEIIERVGLQVAQNLIETFAYLEGGPAPRFCANPDVIKAR
jgi:D-3-phosphoglycerate dehydrogenase